MRFDLERRRLVAGLASWSAVPALAHAQASGSRIRRVGVLMAVKETDPEGQKRLEALRRALQEAGWVDLRNIVIDTRWYQGSFAIAQEAARDLLRVGTDVVVVNGTPGMDAMRTINAKIPLVFVVVSNPVGAGYVSNLARPGQNITGFSTFEPEIVGKWLQILRQVQPELKHVSMLLDPKFVGFQSLWQALEDVASQFSIAATPAFASTLEEIETEIEKVAAIGNSALIVAPSPVNTVNRLRVIELTNQRRLPAIYPFRFYVRDGALVAYGFNAADQFRRAANYVDRILKGEEPGSLPIQAPSLFEMGVNLKTAKSLGIVVPQSLLISADEIVE